jgi:1,4-alpha-glucan branching enzyme
MSPGFGAGARGFVAFVLHAHLPYVRHPEHEFFLEEEWLFEAVTEAYLALLQVMEGLVDDGVPFRLTLVLTPPLVTMLDDELLHWRYRRHLDLLLQLSEAELQRTAGDGHLHYLARHYRDRFVQTLAAWEACRGDLVGAFGRLQQAGYLDIITCGATHGYLPLMQVCPAAAWAQIKVAADHYRSRFGRPPTGIWLPECGYYPGLDRLLAAAGLRYFVADTHAVLFAEPRPHFGSYAPVYAAGSGVAVFPRDRETSNQVWSREQGYPGDPDYREFYRDIGWDLAEEQIAPFLRPSGVRKNTGIKYHRITGPTDEKQLYDPYWARRRAVEHAEHFVAQRLVQLDRIKQAHKAPLVVAPYDAELFGHWWYEGPWWLDRVLRILAEQQRSGSLATTHLREYLQCHPTHQLVQPTQSSWGEHGFHQYWLNESNEWVYPRLHLAATQMVELAERYPSAEGLRCRALNQAARELLLAQSSDWAFIMRSKTVVEYAVQRTRRHLGRFAELRRQAEADEVDVEWLSRLEYLDAIFPEIDYRVYRRRS